MLRLACHSNASARHSSIVRGRRSIQCQYHSSRTADSKIADLVRSGMGAGGTRSYPPCGWRYGLPMPHAPCGVAPALRRPARVAPAPVVAVPAEAVGDNPRVVLEPQGPALAGGAVVLGVAGPAGRAAAAGPVPLAG